MRNFPSNFQHRENSLQFHPNARSTEFRVAFTWRKKSAWNCPKRWKNKKISHFLFPSLFLILIGQTQEHNNVILIFIFSAHFLYDIWEGEGVKKRLNWAGLRGRKNGNEQLIMLKKILLVISLKFLMSHLESPYWKIFAKLNNLNVVRVSRMYM